MNKARERLIQNLQGTEEKVFYAISLEHPVNTKQIQAELCSLGVNMSPRSLSHIVEDLVSKKIVKKLTGQRGPAAMATYQRLPGPPRNKQPELSVVKKPIEELTDVPEITIPQQIQEIRARLDQLELAFIQQHEEIEHERHEIKEEKKELAMFKEMMRKFTAGD